MYLLADFRLRQLWPSPPQSFWLWRRCRFCCCAHRCSFRSNNLLVSFLLWLYQRTLACGLPWPCWAYWVLSNCRRFFFRWFTGNDGVWTKWINRLYTGQRWGALSFAFLESWGGVPTSCGRNSTETGPWSWQNVVRRFTSESWRRFDCPLEIYGNVSHLGWL